MSAVQLRKYISECMNFINCNCLYFVKEMNTELEKGRRRSTSRSDSRGRRKDDSKYRRKLSRSRSRSSRSGSRRRSRSRDSSIEERRRLRRQNRRDSRSSSRERFIRNRQKTRQWLTKGRRGRDGGGNRGRSYQQRFRNRRRSDLPRNPSPLLEPFKFSRNYRSPVRDEERPKRRERSRGGSSSRSRSPPSDKASRGNKVDSPKRGNISKEDSSPAKIGIESTSSRSDGRSTKTKSSSGYEPRLEINLISSTTPDVGLLTSEQRKNESSENSSNSSSSSSSEDRKKKKKSQKKIKKERKRKRRKSKKRDEDESSKNKEENVKTKKKGPSKEAEELLRLIGDPTSASESKKERGSRKKKGDSESEGFSSSSRTRSSR